MVQSGELAGSKVGGRWVISRGPLEALIAETKRDRAFELEVDAFSLLREQSKLGQGVLSPTEEAEIQKEITKEMHGVLAALLREEEGGDQEFDVQRGLKRLRQLVKGIRGLDIDMEDETTGDAVPSKSKPVPDE